MAAKTKVVIKASLHLLKLLRGHFRMPGHSLRLSQVALLFGICDLPQIGSPPFHAGLGLRGRKVLHSTRVLVQTERATDLPVTGMVTVKSWYAELLNIPLLE